MNLLWYVYVRNYLLEGYGVMKKTLDSLRAFLENARRNGTTCAAAEAKLALAKHLLAIAGREGGAEELFPIVGELEEIHKLCLAPITAEAPTAEEECECG
jgi:hypothetical protein